MAGTTTTTLTRDVLQNAKCENPGCTEDHPLALNARCHPGVPLFAWFHKDDGILLLVCAECGEPVAAVQVAWAT